MKIAYLGPEKTFTEKVARELFPKGDLVPIQPIRNVVMAVENGKVERGIVPLENFYLPVDERFGLYVPLVGVQECSLMYRQG